LASVIRISRPPRAATSCMLEIVFSNTVSRGPSTMTGMLLSGASPLYAAIYQFVVIAMILASSGLTSLLSTMMIRNHAFSPAEQLILKERS